ncbi:MAG TPA: homocysteine S-methyltransferase family protein [bacterium]|mgnify:FL=1|nr:homocysteine S-methyltransferase family protein [bacterium]
MNYSFLDALRERILVFDGAMGTMLMRYGLTSGACSEEWNISKPERIEEIHRSYIAAGADCIETNTFGANRFRLSAHHLDDRVIELNIAGARIAKKASQGRAFVVGSVGPTGKILEPFGDLSFEDAYNAFKEQVMALEEGGVDAIIIETMGDLQEARVALLACKENTELPVICQMSFSENLRTTSGTPPEVSALVLWSLGADVVGANCSMGSDGLYRVLERMVLSGVPYISIQPNAGLPIIEDGKLIYPETPEQLAEFAVKYVELGASIVGSCCGSTPEHTKAISNAVRGLKRTAIRKRDSYLAFTSRTRLIEVGKGLPVAVIGEKLNAYAEECKSLLDAKDMDGLVELGREQVQSGARAIDMHIPVSSTVEREFIRELMINFQQFGDVPLVFDIQEPDTLEMALRIYPGRALINSISLEPSREGIIDLARKYGAAIVGLTSGKYKLPVDADERIKNGEELISLFNPKDRVDIVLDPLVFSVGVSPEQALETLKALEHFNSKGYLTIIGLSNISYGLPKRSLLNRIFLSMAVSNGLDSVILDPTDKDLMETLVASQTITGRISVLDYIKKFK